MNAKIKRRDFITLVSGATTAHAQGQEAFRAAGYSVHQI